jgi:lactoylglutathione lyase
MKTSCVRKTTAGALLAGCLILASAGLILALVAGPTAAQPQPSAPKAERAAGKRLNHIDLVVANVAENRAFFEKYFGFKCIVSVGDDLAVMTDGTDFSLVLSGPEVAAEIGQIQRTGKADPMDKGPGGADAKKPIEYPAGFHIGFHQDSKEAVDEMYKKLKEGGVAVEKPQEYHGAWTFYVRAPGGYYVEVFHQARRGR